MYTAGDHTIIHANYMNLLNQQQTLSGKWSVFSSLSELTCPTFFALLLFKLYIGQQNWIKSITFLFSKQTLKCRRLRLPQISHLIKLGSLVSLELTT